MPAPGGRWWHPDAVSARAKKSLGQNFLVDPSVSSRIVDAAAVRAGDTVIEIGPGRGALTEGLRGRGERLVLVEKDDALAASLAYRYSTFSDVAVLNADALQLQPSDVPFPGPYRVVANLPYNVGGRITMHLLEDWPGHVRSMTLMFQREVANRITASPGSKAYGSLTVLVQSMAETWSLFGVPPGAFRPVPKVQSSVVRIQPRAEALWAGLDYGWFRRVVKAGFSARRKTIVNALQGGLGSDRADEIAAALEAAGIRPGLRPDALPVAAWIELARNISAPGTE